MGGSLQRRHWLDRIGLNASTWSYRLDRIGIGLGFDRRNWILCTGYFDTVWMGWVDWMGRWWGRGGMEVPTLAGAGIGAPPLAPEQERYHWLLRSGGRW